MMYKFFTQIFYQRVHMYLDESYCDIQELPVRRKNTSEC